MRRWLCLGLILGTTSWLQAQPLDLPTPTTLEEALQQHDQLEKQLNEIKEEIKTLPLLVRNIEDKEKELAQLTARRDRLRMRKGRHK